MREFPHFVQLHEQLGKDVACASLNLNYYGDIDEGPETAKPDVLKFLTSKKASTQNFISSTADEEVLKQIETASIPAAIVYDRSGNVHTIFNNDKEEYGPEGFNYEDDVTPLVKQLMEATE